MAPKIELKMNQLNKNLGQLSIPDKDSLGEFERDKIYRMVEKMKADRDTEEFETTDIVNKEEKVAETPSLV